MKKRAIRKMAIVSRSLDPARLTEFQALLKPHRCTIELITNEWWPAWRVESKDGERRSTGFDVDIPRIADFLAKGVPLGGIDLHDFGAREQVRTSTKARDTSVLCTVCGEPGGLPCPKMHAQAKKFRITIIDTPGTNVHPGRCRARLKGWITAADAAATAKKAAQKKEAHT